MTESFDETLDFSNVVLRNIGRPRRALIAGCDADLAQGLGDRIVSLSHVEVVAAPTPSSLEKAAGDVDVAVLNATPDWDLPAFLKAAKSRLTDGGHVLVYSRNHGTRARDRMVEALDAEGFEVLRFDGVPSALRPVAENLIAGVHTSELMRASARSLLRKATNPLEMLLGSSLPERFADSELVVARLPPARRKLSLSIGMLTLNEIESVERMIADIRRVAPDAKLILIDSSSDATPQIARDLGARVVRQLPPRGHGPAMERLMYEVASESDALIYLDCDFTYPVDEIPKILKMLEDGADVVNASRTRHRPEAMPLPNFIANRAFAAAAQVAHGVPTTDVHSGMRGYRSSVMRAFAFSGERDALPLDTLILPARSGYNVIEYAIPYYERVGVSKLQKLSGTIWTFGRIAAAYRLGERVKRGRRYVVQGD